MRVLLKDDSGQRRTRQIWDQASGERERGAKERRGIKKRHSKQEAASGKQQGQSVWRANSPISTPL